MFNHFIISTLIIRKGSRVSRKLSVLAILAVLAAAAPPLSAQTYDESIDVRVIQIPVNVSRGGKPVEGLTRDDFELFVNGRRQEIAYFDTLEFAESGTPREGRPPTATVDLTERRLTLLLFDAANSSFQNMRLATRQVEELVTRSSPGDYFAVGLLPAGRGVRYIVPFTHDRSAIRHAVSTLSRSSAGDPLSLALAPQERARATAALRGLPSAATAEQQHADYLEEGVAEFEEAVGAGRGSGLQVPSLLNNLEGDRRWRSEFATADWIEALGAMAGDLAPLEGVKQVVLFSEAMAIASSSPMIYGPRIDRMHAKFRRSGVILHVVDIAGLRLPGRVDDGAPSTPDLFFSAAGGTGGRVIHGTGIENAVRVLGESRSVTYLLGFHPPANEAENNRIRVKVRGQRFAAVSYRQGYTRAGNQARDASGLLLADIMLNDIRRNDLTVNIRVSGREPVRLEVTVPGDEFLGHERLDSITADVIVYVFDAAGNVAVSNHRRFSVDAAKSREALSGRFVVITELFSLASGRYVAKALVRVTGRDLMGFHRAEFTLEDRASE
jgi:VWFA-related protein